MALIDHLNDAVFDYINDDKVDQLFHDFALLIVENYEHHQARATSLACIADKLVSILPPADQ